MKKDNINLTRKQLIKKISRDKAIPKPILKNSSTELLKRVDKLDNSFFVVGKGHLTYYGERLTMNTSKEAKPFLFKRLGLVGATTAFLGGNAMLGIEYFDGMLKSEPSQFSFLLPTIALTCLSFGVFIFSSIQCLLSAKKFNGEMRDMSENVLDSIVNILEQKTTDEAERDE